MIQGFKFTLLAASYTCGRNTYIKRAGHLAPTIILEDGDPRIAEFRGNPAFKEEPIKLPDKVAAKVPVKKESKLKGKKGDSLDFLPEKQANVLMEAGLETPADVIEAGIDGLLTLNGIGEITAEKILSDCKAHLEEESVEDE